MRVSMQQTIDGLNILDDNFDWDHSLFCKCFEVVEVTVQGLFDENLMEGASQSASMEAHNQEGKGRKLPDHFSEGQFETLPPP